MFEEEILQKMKEMHSSGMTYEEISENTGISKAVVGFYISGARPIKNPSISLLMKVFPNCRIDLDGNCPPETASASDQSDVQPVDEAKIRKEAREDFRNQVIKALITLDMRAEDSLLALKTIQNL